MVKEPQPEKRGLTEISKSFATLLDIKGTTADDLRKGFKAKLPNTHDILDAILRFDVEAFDGFSEAWRDEAEAFGTKRKTLRVTAKATRKVSKMSDEERKALIKALGVQEIKVV